MDRSPSPILNILREHQPQFWDADWLTCSRRMISGHSINGSVSCRAPGRSTNSCKWYGAAKEARGASPAAPPAIAFESPTPSDQAGVYLHRGMVGLRASRPSLGEWPKRRPGPHDSRFLVRNPLRTSRLLKGPATGDWPSAWMPSRRKPLRGRAAFTDAGTPDAALPLRTAH